MYKYVMTSAPVARDFLDAVKNLGDDGFEMVAAYAVLERQASILLDEQGNEIPAITRHYAIMRKSVKDVN